MHHQQRVDVEREEEQGDRGHAAGDGGGATAVERRGKEQPAAPEEQHAGGIHRQRHVAEHLVDGRGDGEARDGEGHGAIEPGEPPEAGVHGEERPDPAGHARHFSGGNPSVERWDQAEGREEPAFERLARLPELPREDSSVGQAKVGVGSPAVPDEMGGEKDEAMGEEEEKRTANPHRRLRELHSRSHINNGSIRAGDAFGTHGQLQLSTRCRFPIENLRLARVAKQCPVTPCMSHGSSAVRVQNGRNKVYEALETSVSVKRGNMSHIVEEAEMRHGDHPCSWRHHRDVPSNDDSTTWSLCGCEECGLVRLAHIPAQDVAYPSEYYGQGGRKFVPGVEAVSKIRPALLTSVIRRCEQAPARIYRKPRVLDVGCGRGYLLRDLAARGWDCAGIDIPGAPLPRDADALGFDCRVGDAGALPWAAESFDLVVINHVLEHVRDPWAACHEANRVLRNGGMLYIGVPNYGSLQSRLFGAHWFPLEVPRHIYHFSKSALSRVLKESGFTPISWSTRSFRQGVFAWTQSGLNLLDRSMPNRLLAVLKGEISAFSARSLLHIAGAGVLAPVGVAEGCVASVFGCGSVLIVASTKSSNPG